MIDKAKRKFYRDKAVIQSIRDSYMRDVTFTQKVIAKLSRRDRILRRFFICTEYIIKAPYLLFWALAFASWLLTRGLDAIVDWVGKSLDWWCAIHAQPRGLRSRVIKACIDVYSEDNKAREGSI